MEPNRMDSPNRPYRPRSVVGPVLLILLGIAFLVTNLGLVQWNVWELMWRLWPVWLIAAGLDLMLGRRSAWASWVILGVVLALVSGSIWFAQRWTWGGAAERIDVSQPLDGARQANVVIKSGVGELRIAAGGDRLIEGFAVRWPGQTIRQDVHHSGDTLYYTLQTESGSWSPISTRGDVGRWDLRLTPQIPLSLEISTGVGESNIDLSELQLTRLEAQTGVGETTIILPAQGRLSATVECGVGATKVLVPEGMAVRLKARQGLGAVQIEIPYERLGDDYVTPGYEAAQHRVELEVKGGVGAIQIRPWHP
jgi:hypothetical protein